MSDILHVKAGILGSGPMGKRKTAARMPGMVKLSSMSPPQ